MATSEQFLTTLAEHDVLDILNYTHYVHDDDTPEQLAKIRKKEGHPEDKWTPITHEGLAPQLWVREERLHKDGTITSHEGYLVGVNDGHWVTERDVRITPAAKVLDKNYDTRLYANEGKAVPLPTLPGSMIFETFVEPRDGQGTGRYDVMICDQNGEWTGVEKRSGRAFTGIKPEYIRYWSDLKM